jgi:ABC-type antimicrobial peptide transport system permease subunit
VIPISGSGWDRGARADASDEPRAVNLSSVSEGYFRVMQMPILAGRDFNSTDRRGATPVAIVNQTFTRVFFRGRNPVGKLFRLDGPEPPFEIVGITADTKYRTLDEEFTPIVYFAASQEQTPRLTVRYVIRASGAPEALIKPVKDTLAAMDPRLSVRFVVLESQIRESVLRERLMAALTSAFGVLGAMLALTGVFGVTAYVVARRFREFGVRIARGASRAGIVRLVLGQIATVLLAGVVLGGCLAIVLGKAASKLLYGITPNDVPTMLTAICILTGGGLIAGLLPALRASRVSPVEALRVE